MATDRTSAFRRRLAIAAAITTVMFMAGWFLSVIGRPSPSEPSESVEAIAEVRPVVPAGVASPVSEQAGVDVGFAADEDGAVAAAVSYATAAQRWLYFTDDEITAAVTEIATPTAAPRLVDDVLADVGLAREQLVASPGRVWWLVRPLAWNVTRFGVDEASVSVWTVTVLSAAEVAAPQAEWITVTVDLAWIAGDWRVEAVRDTPGPTPMAGPKDIPWDAVPFDDALAGFTRVDGEALS